MWILILSSTKVPTTSRCEDDRGWLMMGRDERVIDGIHPTLEGSSVARGERD